jgi:hypothetical protein
MIKSGKTVETKLKGLNKSSQPLIAVRENRLNGSAGYAIPSMMIPVHFVFNAT